MFVVARDIDFNWNNSFFLIDTTAFFSVWELGFFLKILRQQHRKNSCKYHYYIYYIYIRNYIYYEYKYNEYNRGRGL